MGIDPQGSVRRSVPGRSAQPPESLGAPPAGGAVARAFRWLMVKALKGVMGSIDRPVDRLVGGGGASAVGMDPAHRLSSFWGRR